MSTFWQCWLRINIILLWDTKVCLKSSRKALRMRGRNVMNWLPGFVTTLFRGPSTIPAMLEDILGNKYCCLSSDKNNYWQQYSRQIWKQCCSNVIAFCIFFFFIWLLSVQVTYSDYMSVKSMVIILCFYAWYPGACNFTTWYFGLNQRIMNCCIQIMHFKVSSLQANNFAFGKKHNLISPA